MATGDMPLEEQLGHLERLAAGALGLWELPSDASVRLINVSENATYLVEGADGFRAVLRVHREHYHSRRAIECELAWIDALRADEVVAVPGYYRGRDGHAIQSAGIDGLDAQRYLVLFRFVAGRAPDESGDMCDAFEVLGAMAARTHLHSMQWTRPDPFERLVWNEETVFGSEPTWGDWRDAPNLDDAMRKVLETVEATVRHRLAAFGKRDDRYGLIHADMRLANLLVDDSGTWLIDFDDCGFGWYLYDFAAAISFIEDDPRIPAIKAAWVRGYRRVRELSDDDVAEIETFVMLRRLALLAWIGSHLEAPEPQALAPDFARRTAVLGAEYLRQVVSSAPSGTRSPR